MRKIDFLLLIFTILRVLHSLNKNINKKSFVVAQLFLSWELFSTSYREGADFHVCCIFQPSTKCMHEYEENRIDRREICLRLHMMTFQIVCIEIRWKILSERAVGCALAKKKWKKNSQKFFHTHDVSSIFLYNAR